MCVFILFFFVVVFFVLRTYELVCGVPSTWRVSWDISFYFVPFFFPVENRVRRGRLLESNPSLL